mgnify:CR=1 FL=1
MFKGSWKTTLSGIMGIIVAGWQLIGAPILDSDPTTVANFSAFIPVLLVGLGLVAARDNDKSSEQVGTR